MSKEFGKYIKSLRESNGYTLRDVEIHTGLSNSYISKLERGMEINLTVKSICKLAELYKVSAQELINILISPKKRSFSSIDSEIELDGNAKSVALIYSLLSKERKQSLMEFLEYLFFKQTNTLNNRTVLQDDFSTNLDLALKKRGIKSPSQLRQESINMLIETLKESKI